MRRFVGLGLGVLILASCSDLQNPSPVDVLPEDDSTPPSSYQIHDGSSGGVNPHFFFLPPVAETSPETDGVPDDDLEPVVDICYLVGDTEEELACGDDLATFTMEDDLSVIPGVGYNAVWKTNDYGVVPGERFRITVSIELPGDQPSLAAEELVLGWADVKAYDNQAYSSFQYTDPDGYIAISDNGNLNIKFLIEKDLLQSKFCVDPESVEDCDVKLFYPDESPGEADCLEVYKDPDLIGLEVLGSRACIPANGAPKVGDEPVTGVYAVALTLEKDAVSQGGATPPIPGEIQLPHLPDVTTYPSGIAFDPGSDGIQLTICQVEAYFEGHEDLLFDVQPFLMFTRVGSDGTITTNVVLPEDYFIDPLACDNEPVGDGTLASASRPEGFLGHLAAGLSRVSDLFRPKPLVARRLHGGLNTTVYNTSGGDAPEGGENVAAFAGIESILLDGDQFLVEAGGVLPPSADASIGTVPSAGLQETESSFTIEPLDGLGRQPAYNVFPVVVEWWVDGANQVGSALEPNQATGPDGDGLFTAAYVPFNHGTDYIFITVNGEQIPGSPFEHVVAPRKGDINVTIDLSGPGVAPEDGLPVNLYSGTQLIGTATTDAFGVATFTDIVFGSFTVHLPKRDFDAAFPTMTQSLEHHSAPSEITFTGTTQALPAEVAVYRVKDGGNGNAFEYILNNRSWTSAQNQVGNNVLLGVPAHLASITSAGENVFVAALVASKCPNETNPKKCKYQGWIGLNDQASEGNFVWTTGEALTFTSWDVGEPSGRNNEDHVEINLNGTWSDENGASSTNEGYVGEWEAVQPATPPF